MFENSLKQRYLYILFSWLILTLIGCSESPEKRLQVYLQYSYLRQDEHKAYIMLSAEDRKYKTEKEFMDVLQQECSYSKKFVLENKDLFGFKILQIENKDADTVRIKVLIERPNSENILENILSLTVEPHHGSLNGSKRKKMIEKKLEKLLKDPVFNKESEEKEYLLIRENGTYSIFLNLGSSIKKAREEELVIKMEKEADEKLRKIDFDGAMKIYQRITSQYPEVNMDFRMEELTTILRKTIHIGEIIQTGNLKIVPLEIGIKRASIHKKNWGGSQPIITLTQEPCLALTFEITNIGDGEIFDFFDLNRFKNKNSVRDNFGNEMHEYFLDFDVLAVEGNNLKPIKPGESRKIVVLCEGILSPKASRFLWEMSLLTDNKKTEDKVYISFTRGQIKGENNSN